MTESVPLQVPLIGLQMNSETAHYVGMLEGTIAALVVNEVKYRTLLELLTGDKWDSAEMPTEPKDIMALAVSVLVKQTGIDKRVAESLVLQRINETNRDPVVPDRPANVVVTQQATPPMADRYKEWKQRQMNLATGGEES